MNSSARESQSSPFHWAALATILALLTPFVAMQFTDEVQWYFGDFVVMGLLVSVFASMFVLLARIVRHKHRFPVAVALIMLFLYIWAELAVGIFTDLGS